MSFRPLLLLRIALVQEGKIDYLSVFALVLVVAIAVLVGILMWQVGLDLVRSGRRANRLGGGLLLAIASAYTLAIGGLCYWEVSQIWEWF